MGLGSIKFFNWDQKKSLIWIKQESPGSVRFGFGSGFPVPVPAVRFYIFFVFFRFGLIFLFFRFGLFFLIFFFSKNQFLEFFEKNLIFRFRALFLPYFIRRNQKKNLKNLFFWSKFHKKSVFCL